MLTLYFKATVATRIFGYITQDQQQGYSVGICFKCCSALFRANLLVHQ